MTEGHLKSDKSGSSDTRLQKFNSSILVTTDFRTSTSITVVDVQSLQCKTTLSSLSFDREYAPTQGHTGQQLWQPLLQARKSDSHIW